MQESSSEKLDSRREQPASDPSREEEKPREKESGQGSHEHKREKKGKDK